MKLFPRILLTVSAFFAVLLVMLNWHTLPVQLLVALAAALIAFWLLPSWYRSLAVRWYAWEAKRESNRRVAAAQAALAATTAGQNPAATPAMPRTNTIKLIFLTFAGLVVGLLFAGASWLGIPMIPTSSDMNAGKAIFADIVGVAFLAFWTLGGLFFATRK